VRSAKGFYVRSLGRDLARALGTRGHLHRIHRTRSGPFTLDAAVPFDAVERARDDDEARVALTARLLSPVEACAHMPRVVLDDRGVEDARHGRLVRAAAIPEEGTEPVALLDRRGVLVAIARSAGERLHVVRGFPLEAGGPPPGAG